MEEISQLKSIMLQKDNEWKKEKALLEQKIELQKLSIQELKAREENYKKFNDTILNAYNSLNSDSGKATVKIMKEIQQNLDSFSRDLIESKIRTTDTASQYEGENRQLRLQVKQMEQQIKETTDRYENEKLQMEQRIFQLQSELAQCQKQFDSCQNETKKNKTQNQELQNQIKELQTLMQSHSQKYEIEKQLIEEHFNQKQMELEKQYHQNITFLQEMYRGDKMDVISIFDKKSTFDSVDDQSVAQNKKSDNQSEKQNQIKSASQDSDTNKENLGSLQQQESDLNHYYSQKGFRGSGCIVTAKSRVDLQRTNNYNQKSQIYQYQKGETFIKRGSDSYLKESKKNENQIIKTEESAKEGYPQKNELRKSSLPIQNQKESILSEVIPQYMLNNIELGKEVEEKTNKTPQQLHMRKISQLENQQTNIKNLLFDLENRQPSKYTVTEHSRLKEQLKKISKDLKKAKLEFCSNQECEQSEKDTTNLLKNEIQYMISNLRKAKGKLSESFINISSQAHSRFQSKQDSTIGNESFVQKLNFIEDVKKKEPVDPSGYRSLESFTRQLNKASNMETFTSVVNQGKSTKNSKSKVSSIKESKLSDTKRYSINQVGNYRNGQLLA